MEPEMAETDQRAGEMTGLPSCPDGRGWWVLPCLLASILAASSLAVSGEIVFETTSPYHSIQVIERGGVRILSFDGTRESKMSIADPLQGHFEYTEFFHMPWLWNTNIGRVLMIGLGGASTQRAFQHYYPDLAIETAEIDPTVVWIAKQYFTFQESPRQRVHLSDGRLFLKRTRTQYDLIILDAYTRGRYGSFIPPHLVTREFFELADRHLTTNGVLAYNVISSTDGADAGILGALYRTLSAVFPHVYLFPCRSSKNVVLIATKSPQKVSRYVLTHRAATLVQQKRVQLPGFKGRLNAFRAQAPSSARHSPLLTDDYAPVEGLLQR